MIMLIVLLSFLMISSYCLLIFKWNNAWNNIPVSNDSEKLATVMLSIIIPVRNEQANIVQVLNSLCNQNYPEHLFEIIISDDHSTDNTIKIAKDFFANQNNINGIIVETKTTDSSSKKEAIKRAIEIAKGELIITTDADCVHDVQWLQTFASYFILHQPVMI